MNEKKTIKERVKEFGVKHEKKIKIACMVTSACIGGYLGYKVGNNKTGKSVEYVPAGLHNFENIDEEIFTFIAPKIEEAVMDKNRSVWGLESCFPIGDGLKKTLHVVVSEAEKITKEAAK